MEFPHVSVLHVDFEDGRQAATETGWESPFGDAHVLHCIRVEHTEKPKQMAHAVQRHAVEKHEVLVWRPATDIQSTCALSPALHPGKQLKGLQQVHLSTNGRQGFDLVDGDLHLGHLHLLLDSVFLVACHHRLSERQSRLQFQIEFDIHLGQIHRESLRRVAQVTDTDRVGSLRDGQGIETVHVGRDALRYRLGPNRGANQRFSGCGIRDVATECAVLRMNLGPSKDPTHDHQKDQTHGRSVHRKMNAASW